MVSVTLYIYIYYGCYTLCVNCPEHTLEVCPAWTEHRRVLFEAIGGGDPSRPALVKAVPTAHASMHGHSLRPSAKQ